MYILLINKYYHLIILLLLNERWNKLHRMCLILCCRMWLRQFFNFCALPIEMNTLLCNFYQSPYNPTFTDLVSSQKRVPLPSIISPVTIYRLNIWMTVKAVMFISTVVASIVSNYKEHVPTIKKSLHSRHNLFWLYCLVVFMFLPWYM